MWLSQQTKQEASGESLAQIGCVSIPGASAAVFLEGERRNVSVVSPGGYHWQPEQRDDVLVLACGTEQSPCMIGMEQASERIAPGEVWISVTENSGIHFRKDGTVNLVGDILLNGEPLVMPKAAKAGGGTV